MVVDGNESIKIKQVLLNGTTPAFVEYWSENTSRNHIINASRFCETFGFSMDDLKQLQAQKEQ